MKGAASIFRSLFPERSRSLSAFPKPWKAPGEMLSIRLSARWSSWRSFRPWKAPVDMWTIQLESRYNTRVSWGMSKGITIRFLQLHHTTPFPGGQSHLRGHDWWPCKPWIRNKKTDNTDISAEFFTNNDKILVCRPRTLIEKQRDGVESKWGW